MLIFTCFTSLLFVSGCLVSRTGECLTGLFSAFSLSIIHIGSSSAVEFDTGLVSSTLGSGGADSHLEAETATSSFTSSLCAGVLFS
jgi:hypothetical protein